MSANPHQVSRFLARIFGETSRKEVASRLSGAGLADGRPERFPGGTNVSARRLQRRWKRLGVSSRTEQAICDQAAMDHAERYSSNIENYVGTVKVPMGVAGPVRVAGLFAEGDYFVPLATTEAALVASYHRGCHLLTQAGGARSVLVNAATQRAPVFEFTSVAEGLEFVAGAMSRLEELREVAAGTTNHGQLIEIQPTLEGNHVYLTLLFDTADASGQNMVTIAGEAVARALVESSPVPIKRWYVEGNLSGDKKASAQSFTTVRGRKVTCEARLPAELVQSVLHVTPREMEDYWRLSALGGVMSGTMGVHGHFANGLAALYLATGQDVACTAESSVGVTRFEVEQDGGLYAAVTLPNLMLGTVGGGTGLPSQQAGLEILGLAGAGQANALAEVCGALLLAGELSIIGALAAGEFVSAHESLARKKTS